MKRLLFWLTLAFVALTFCGAGYVISTGGQASAGYACIPMLFGITFMGLYRRTQEKQITPKKE